MGDNNERQLQEYEFVLEGITTRMQLAIEKMAESNRMMSESNHRLCDVLKNMCWMVVVVVIIVILTISANNRLWLNHEEKTRQNTTSEVVTDAGAVHDAAIPQSGP